LIAVGVNSNLPSTQSPIAKISLALVVSSSLQIILPFLLVFIPTDYSPKVLVSAFLPIASMTISYSLENT